MRVKRTISRIPQQTHPKIIFESMLRVLFPNWINAIKMYTKTSETSVATVIILDNLFLKGLLMNIKSPSKTEVNIRIGRANIGSLVKTPMMTP